MKENCLRHLEEIQALLMTSTGENDDRKQQQQTQEHHARSPRHAADTDSLITTIALNQTMYPHGNADVDTEIQSRKVSLRNREIRILIAGQ